MMTGRSLMRFLSHHVVPAVSVVCAALSFFLADGFTWARAIHWDTINLLFCLMTVVAGLDYCNLFGWLSDVLLGSCRRVRTVAVLLVLLTFFASMLVTNDVILLVSVPFAISLFNRFGIRRRIPLFIVLLTLAANLGSIATPVGNPQNIFIFSKYELASADFFAVTLPVAGFGLLLTLLSVLFVPQKEVKVRLRTGQQLTHRRLLIVVSVLFVFCLLTVFKVIPGFWLFVQVTIITTVTAPRLLRKVDYGLLLTFICFFVFSDNIANYEPFRVWLCTLLERFTMLTALLTSQVISNVPAAILLQPFTDNWQGLLLGVSLGGLGTPIASLASLISLNIYLRERDARLAYFMRSFLLFNFVLLLPLILFVWLIYL